MTREDRKATAIIITLVLVITALFGGTIKLSWQQEAPPKCYDQFRSTYTWGHKLDKMNEIWADRIITLGECETVKEIYADVAVERKRKAIDAEKGRW